MNPNTSTVQLSMVICSTKYVKNASQKNNVMKYFYVMVTAVESLPHNMRFGLFNNAAIIYNKDLRCR